MKWLILSFKNIFRNKRRSFLSVLSIGVVAFVVSFMACIVQGMQDDLIKNIKILKTGDFYIQNANFEKYQLFNPLDLLVDPKKIEPVLKKYPDLKSSQNLNFTLSYYKDGEMFFSQGMAFSMANQVKQIKQGRSIFKVYKNQGTLPQGDKEVAIALNMAIKNHIKVGDKVALLAQTASKNQNAAGYTVTAIVYFSVSAFNNNTVIFDIPGAQRLIKTDKVTRILVRSPSDKATHQYVQELSSSLGANAYDIKGWYDSKDANIIGVQRVINIVVNLVFFTLGGSIIINTSMMNILERRREIGMMSSLGVSVREVRSLFFLESIWLGLIGTVGGMALGIGLALILNHTGWDLLGEAASSSTGLALSQTLYPRPSFWPLMRVFGFAFVISIVVSYIPTGKIAKLNPADAFRN